MTGFTRKIWMIIVLCLAVVAISAASAVICTGTNVCRVLTETRPPVDFLDNYHESHMDDFDCIVCHHKYVNGKNVLEDDDIEDGDSSLLCSSCHNKKSKITLSEAFHKECIGCHEKLGAEGQATGPILCGGCHIRRTVKTAVSVYGGKNG